MKEFTEQHINDILKLKYGSVVADENHTSYVTDKVLATLFKVSASKIR